MSASRVVYHEGAAAEVRSVLAWYEKRNPKVALDFIEELNRAAEVIRKAPERWPFWKQQNPPIPAVAISIYHHLFAKGRGSHNLGCRPWKPSP